MTKKLIIFPGGQFGPFLEVETLPDAYRVGTTIYHFNVIGSPHSIEDYVADEAAKVAKRKPIMLLKIYELLQAKLNGDMTLSGGQVVGIRKSMLEIAHGIRKSRPFRKLPTKNGSIEVNPAQLLAIDDEVDIFGQLLADFATDLQIAVESATTETALNDIDLDNVTWPIEP